MKRARKTERNTRADVVNNGRAGRRRADRPAPEKNRRTTGQFQPGQSGNVAGRPAGVPNKATSEAKALCALLVDDPAYRTRLKARLLAGELPPAVECMLWHYRFGKPKERVEVEGGASLLELLAAAGARTGA